MKRWDHFNYIITKQLLCILYLKIYKNIEFYTINNIEIIISREGIYLLTLLYPD